MSQAEQVEKRIFSPNTISFLRANGLREIRMGYDPERNQVYSVFSEGGETGRLMKIYKSDKNKIWLKTFAEFQGVKEDFRKIKEAYEQV